MKAARLLFVALLCALIVTAAFIGNIVAPVSAAFSSDANSFVDSTTLPPSIAVGDAFSVLRPRDAIRHAASAIPTFAHTSVLVLSLELHGRSNVTQEREQLRGEMMNTVAFDADTPVVSPDGSSTTTTGTDTAEITWCLPELGFASFEPTTRQLLLVPTEDAIEYYAAMNQPLTRSLLHFNPEVDDDSYPVLLSSVKLALCGRLGFSHNESGIVEAIATLATSGNSDQPSSASSSTSFGMNGQRRWTVSRGVTIVVEEMKIPNPDTTVSSRRDMRSLGFAHLDASLYAATASSYGVLQSSAWCQAATRQRPTQDADNSPASDAPSFAFGMSEALYKKLLRTTSASGFSSSSSSSASPPPYLVGDVGRTLPSIVMPLFDAWGNPATVAAPAASSSSSTTTTVPRLRAMVNGRTPLKTSKTVAASNEVADASNIVSGSTENNKGNSGNNINNNDAAATAVSSASSPATSFDGATSDSASSTATDKDEEGIISEGLHVAHAAPFFYFPAFTVFAPACRCCDGTESGPIFYELVLDLHHPGTPTSASSSSPSSSSASSPHTSSSSLVRSLLPLGQYAECRRFVLRPGEPQSLIIVPDGVYLPTPLSRVRNFFADYAFTMPSSLGVSLNVALSDAMGNRLPVVKACDPDLPSDVRGCVRCRSQTADYGIEFRSAVPTDGSSGTASDADGSNNVVKLIAMPTPPPGALLNVTCTYNSTRNFFTTTLTHTQPYLPAHASAHKSRGRLRLPFAAPSISSRAELSVVSQGEFDCYDGSEPFDSVLTQTDHDGIFRVLFASGLSEIPLTRVHLSPTLITQLGKGYQELEQNMFDWILVPRPGFIYIPLGLFSVMAFGASYTEISTIKIRLSKPFCASLKRETFELRVAEWLYVLGDNATRSYVRLAPTSNPSAENKNARLAVCHGLGIAKMEFVGLKCCRRDEMETTTTNTLTCSQSDLESPLALLLLVGGVTAGIAGAAATAYYLWTNIAKTPCHIKNRRQLTVAEKSRVILAHILAPWMLFAHSYFIFEQTSTTAYIYFYLDMSLPVLWYVSSIVRLAMPLYVMTTPVYIAMGTSILCYSQFLLINAMIWTMSALHLNIRLLPFAAASGLIVLQVFWAIMWGVEELGPGIFETSGPQYTIVPIDAALSMEYFAVVCTLFMFTVTQIEDITPLVAILCALCVVVYSSFYNYSLTAQLTEGYKKHFGEDKNNQSMLGKMLTARRTRQAAENAAESERKVDFNDSMTGVDYDDDGEEMTRNRENVSFDDDEDGEDGDYGDNSAGYDADRAEQNGVSSNRGKNAINSASSRVAQVSSKSDPIAAAANFGLQADDIPVDLRREFAMALLDLKAPLLGGDDGPGSGVASPLGGGAGGSGGMRRGNSNPSLKRATSGKDLKQKKKQQDQVEVVSQQPVTPQQARRQEPSASKPLRKTDSFARKDLI